MHSALASTCPPLLRALLAHQRGRRHFHQEHSNASCFGDAARGGVRGVLRRAHVPACAAPRDAKANSETARSHSLFSMRCLSFPFVCFRLHDHALRSVSAVGPTLLFTWSFMHVLVLCSSPPVSPSYPILAHHSGLSKYTSIQSNRIQFNFILLPIRSNDSITQSLPFFLHQAIPILTILPRPFHWL